MHTSILVWLCVWGLVCCGTVDARASRKKHPHKNKTAELVLTPKEKFCRTHANIAAAIAEDRDALVPLTTTVARLRVILERDLRPFPISDRVVMTQSMVDLAYFFYTTGQPSPAEARHYFEIGCLNPELADGATPSKPPWR